MDELESGSFSFPKIKIKITKKHILIFFIILLIVAAAVAIWYFLKDEQEKKGPEYVDFTDISEKVTITVPTKFEFNVVQNENYNLILTSAISGSSIYISELSTVNIRDLDSYIMYEKNDYISNFSNISDVSDISSTTINDLKVYNYHFNYKTNMFVDVYWILKDYTLYIIDFDVNSESDSLKDHIEEIINSIQIN